MQRSHLLLCVLLFSSCGFGGDVESSTHIVSETVSLEGWRPELISLPPEFAPSLPKGEESLLFAPGMFDAEAEDFWSYVFVLDLEEGSIGKERLCELLELYYDGLLQAVAGGKGHDLGGDPAQVQVVQSSRDRFDATIQLIDAFVTMEALELHLKINFETIETQRTVLHIKASPQPQSHGIWDAMELALEVIE